MDERITKTIENLNKNNMQAVYAENSEKVCEIVKNMLFSGANITSGGSQTLVESGVFGIIDSPEYNLHKRSKPNVSLEEHLEIQRATVGCDFFFTSSNAITESGELVNVDGAGNRVSSICYGPKKVIVIAGVNKIVKDTEEGFLRIKKEAAPKNCIRLNMNTPCSKLGHCISLEKSENPKMTEGCRCDDRICDQYLVTGMQRDKNRITVIICGETLGY